jgi:Porin subfamily
MCSSAGAPVRTAASGGLVAPNDTAALPGCDFKFAVWDVGTRTIWTPVRNLELGVEVMYQKVDQNMDPSQILLSFGGSRDRVRGFYSPASEDSCSGTVRAVRYFYP